MAGISPGEIAALGPAYELDAEPSAEDSAILLMNAGHGDRVEFPANVLGGKDLCRQVQSCTHDESVAGTNGTEASPIAAIRMDGLRVPTSRAEELRGVVAGGLPVCAGRSPRGPAHRPWRPARRRRGRRCSRISRSQRPREGVGSIYPPPFFTSQFLNVSEPFPPLQVS